jgi:hypothetical protein
LTVIPTRSYHTPTQPVFNAKEKLKRGQIKQEDIPYMQRLGSWDGSDVGKKKKWNDVDRKYDQSQKPRFTTVDWQGRNVRPGPAQPKAEPEKKAFKLW